MTPRLVGINHVALQVDDIEEAVAFYTDLFEPTEVSRIPGAAFLRMGDQFLALFQRGPRTEEPHFGLVVDDKEAARRTLEEAGVEILPGRFFDIRDLSGNRVQIVQYDEQYLVENERRIGELDLPVRVVWGAEDAWIPIQTGRRLADLIPGADLVEIPGAGHLIQYDAPVALANVIRAWLTRHSP